MRFTWFAYVLERAAVGVQIAKLHEAEIAELRDRVPRSLRGTISCTSCIVSGEAPSRRAAERTPAPGAGMAKGAAEANLNNNLRTDKRARGEVEKTTYTRRSILTIDEFLGRIRNICSKGETRCSFKSAA